MLVLLCCPLSVPVEQAVLQVNEALENGDKEELVKSLQNPDGNFPFVYQEAKKYHMALLQEGKQGLPRNVLPVFSGVDREACENLLEKMRYELPRSVLHVS